jgi:hypothetical protein
MAVCNALWEQLEEIFDGKPSPDGLSVCRADGRWKDVVWVKLKNADELADAMYWGNPRHWFPSGSARHLDRQLSFPLQRVAEEGPVDGFYAAYNRSRQPLVIVAIRDGRACYETISGAECDPDLARNLLGEVIAYLEENLDFFAAPSPHLH